MPPWIFLFFPSATGPQGPWPWYKPKCNPTSRPMQGIQNKMTSLSSSWTLHLLHLFLLLPVGNTITFSISNRCSDTIWPAAVPGGGVKLDPGESWTLNMPAGTGPGRVWPRTGCSFDSTGKGSCQTGDCGGVLACTSSGQPPVTLAEFTIGGGTDFFDISLVDGFNVPMDFMPIPANGQGGQACSRGPRCAANITSQCPEKLKVPGGCNSACRVFNQDKYCCTGNVSSTCEPTTYSVFFVRGCPDAYSYSRDDSSSTIFSCPSGTNYQEMHEGDEEFGDLPGMPTRFTFQQLQEATDQFRHKIGEGGFGSVFEGQYGEERIAVKRLDRAGQGKREFLAEVQTIGSIHHIHLVRLIGFCAEKSHRLLVYEYMPKGSLDRWIYYSYDNDAPLLDWQTRCKVISHIAKGLCYLHEECMKKIAHLDVKPQNILLDENFNAKISDFGLSKLIDRDKSQVITRMRGTPGYLAPEWLTSQITEKADVYSFGVVVMEIISGRKNLDTSRSEESIHLITLLEEKVKSDELADLIDKYNSDMQAHKQEVLEMMRLAMWCLQIDAKRRPQMSEVIKVLEGHMKAESKIDHNFVATSQTMFGIVENTGSSDPPQASHLSAPR
ncbi:G-type lectin S-receptor-like serine/threonine-protein kinase SD2-5 [Panicum virgatum]|uniref:G-type lectin S-receptor-like serine/threonine-protein kinase SD2-5 n=1 Tax=Panicum virgatum TaxID=38727 RepID=UPI0019D66776|nr:G-type lectin S-receptor-like serine/threonine-protein kinase SD2-5 [Panicum virgatum]